MTIGFPHESGVPLVRRRALAMVARLAAVASCAIAAAQAPTPSMPASRQATAPSTASLPALDDEMAALDANPTAPAERLYNLGVRLYRDGRLADAGEYFERAASRGRADLASRSMYNRGTTSYAESIDAMKAAAGDDGAGAATGSPAQLQQQVMQSLERALRELKDAARADPTNQDARANAELAHRVLKELRKQQQQQQSQDQQNQNQQQQNQDQQQQNQDQQQQSQDQQQQSQDQQQQNQDQQQQNQDQQQQNQDQQQQNQDQQKQDQQQQRQQPRGEAKEKPMTRQEVERLLQKIRDREKQRLFERLSRERGRTQPAPKDW
jgi:Ca-activated chloride channel family protein